MINSDKWEQRRLTARAARRLCDKLEELAEEEDGRNTEQTDKVFRRLWTQLGELVSSLPLELNRPLDTGCCLGCGSPLPCPHDCPAGVALPSKGKHA